MLVEKQFEKLLNSLERFQENYQAGNKRSALCDADYIRDHAVAITYLLLAEIEEENE